MAEPKPYRKDMGHLRWDEVFVRQERRADLTAKWIDALDLRPGSRVLDVGSGPGFVSLALAERVGSQGTVYALDRSADALAYLERLQAERGVGQIRRFVADAATFDLPGQAVDAALVTMVLHHTDDPAAILANVHRLLVPGGRAMVAEFHPDGPCEHGPPREERLSEVQVRQWCEAAGFVILECCRQTPEHYSLSIRRPA